MDDLNYLQDQTLNSVIRNTFSIYRRHFIVVVGVLVLPVIPMVLFISVLDNGSAIQIATLVLIQLWSIFAVAPITIAVSDICLGNAPDIMRCYTRLKVCAWRLAGTFLLYFVVLMIGFLLLYIPGLMLAILLLFTMIVVVIEGRFGFAAMKRSINLCWGHAWRNFGILLVVGFIYGFALVSGSFTLGFVLSSLSLGENFLMAVGALWGGIIAPLFSISSVLLYYDMRSRKENYDAAALTGDIMV